jgi:hypothetical protein
MSALRLLLGFIVVFSGCSIPSPGGVSSETSHYEIRTDVAEPPFAARVSQEAEACHAVLAQAFGSEPTRAFPVVVYRSRRAFNASLSSQLQDRGFIGECGDRYALVYWGDDARGRDTLAHELVHHFSAELMPGLPYWADEGLAKALAPKQSAARWIETVNELSDAEICSQLRGLARLPEGPDYALRCMVAAALVRFGLETETWPDVRALGRWEPDHARFLRWLRSRKWVVSKKFPPVWGNQG